MISVNLPASGNLLTPVNLRQPDVAATVSPQILIVDDDRTTCLVLRQVMERNGYRVRIARSGLEAITTCEEMQQDLILLDYVLPDIDGAQVCAAIRQQQRHASTPILVLTSRNDDASVKTALAAGATDFITKPFIVAVLRQRVGYLLAAIRAEKLMRHLAYHDPLTGLANRAHFHQRLAELLPRSGSSAPMQHAVMCMDLDRFKMVNDACGHGAGDELLRQLAALLQSKLRQTDLLARLGGDEFGALLVDCPPADALAVAEQLREAVSQFCFFWEGRTFTVGVSIGIATLDARTGLPPAKILSAADGACYSAKNSGRNRVEMYEPGTEELQRRKSDLHWAERIDKALAENRFVLNAQRIIPVGAAEQSQHIEILMHMIDETGAVIGASTVLAAAARYNMMLQIDRWLVANALDTLRQRPGWENTSTTCWISISAAAIADVEFPHFIVEQLERSQVPASRLCLQIPEMAMLANIDQAGRFTDMLSQHRVLLALDDFSGGLSSFRALPLSSIQFLKIDSALLTNIAQSPLDYALVKAINDVAHALHIKTVAKQLENAETMSDLRTIGIDMVQGFAVSRPRLLNTIELADELPIGQAAA
jgi:diguanylate cyclase (GGDEF)-like protein